MTNLLKSKRGIENLMFTGLIILFILGVSTILSFLIWDNMKKGFDDIPELNTTTSQSVIAGFDRGFNMYDNIFFFAVCVIIVGIGITAYSLTTPKAYFLFVWGFAFVLGFFAYFFSGLFSEFSNAPILATTMLHFVKTKMLLTNLHWIAILMIIVSTIVRFSKKDEARTL